MLTALLHELFTKLVPGEEGEKPCRGSAPSQTVGVQRWQPWAEETGAGRGEAFNVLGQLEAKAAAAV